MSRAGGRQGERQGAGLSVRFFGPRGPLSPVSAVEVAEYEWGGHLASQKYRDGTLYQLRAPRGVPASRLAEALKSLPEGAVLSRVVHPGDPGNEDLCISFWRPKEASD